MHLVSLAIATNLHARLMVNTFGVSPFSRQYASKIFSATCGANSAESEVNVAIGTPLFTAKRVMSSAAKIRRRPSFAILRMGLLSRASWFRGRVSEKVPGSLTRQQPHECDQRIGHRRPAALKGR